MNGKKKKIKRKYMHGVAQNEHILNKIHQVPTAKKCQ